ncbi:MAG: hypothetical protein FWE46_04865, partial [Coriobacteriia bacterium]|nr:hypothetical protein [Coriobacteriia bacterium]
MKFNKLGIFAVALGLCMMMAMLPINSFVPAAVAPVKIAAATDAGADAEAAADTAGADATDAYQ